MIYYRAEEPFSDCVPKLSLNLKEILPRAHGNFEEQSTVLESSIIINDYCTIIIIFNAYYD
jgi:hypothetical protein